MNIIPKPKNRGYKNKEICDFIKRTYSEKQTNKFQFEEDLK